MHNMSSSYSFLSGAYHLAYYFPRIHGNADTVSEYILYFKDNKEPHTSKWIELATREIRNNIKNIDLIVRVLNSSELSASGGTSLDRLGATIAKYANSNYEKSALRKTRHTKSLKFLSKAERQREINGSYIFQKPLIISRNNPRILLIDDIVTSGTTIREVNRAIKAVLPNCSLFFFTIGKSRQSRDVNNSNILREFRRSEKEIFNDSIQSDPVVKIPKSLSMHGKVWSSAEQEMLVKLVANGDLTILQIANELNRRPGGIKSKIGRLAYGSRISVGSIYVKPEIVSQWQKKLSVGSHKLLVDRKTHTYPSTPTKPSDGCFIATAVYQNANHPVVKDFRLFRDNWMIKNYFGRIFIRFYYKYSPYFAQVLNRSKRVQRIVLVFFIKPIHILITRFRLKVE